ncbi:hypothetical protein IEE94_14985 [Yimella sp. cx-573]|nr:hypothetical protein [Yimella sp. cx-573]
MRVELTRVVRRWQQLPLDRARSLCGQVRHCAQSLIASTDTPEQLPHLSPAATMDQLRVAVYNACVAGRADEALEALVVLRRSL